MFRSARPWWSAILGLVLLALAPPAALGQRFDFLAPPINRAEYARMLELLSLDDPQLAAANALYAGFLSDFETRSGDMRELDRRKNEAFETLAENRKELLAQWRVVWPDFIVTRHRLQRAFLDDLELILTPGQRAVAWPAAARLIRRQQLMHTSSGGAHLWARVDLEKCIERAGLSEAGGSAIAALVDEWAVEIDAVLEAREAMFWEEMRWPKEEQEAREEELHQRDLEFGRRVRDINRRWFRQIAGVLAEPDAGRLEHVVYARAYDLVFGAPRAARDLLDAALALEGLDASEREGLAALAESHQRDSERVERESMRLLDDLDPLTDCFSQRPEPERQALYATDDNPVLPVTRRVEAMRAELEVRTAERVRPLLTPAQRAELDDPRRRSRQGQ